jgi:hypothetical protein
MVVNYSQRCSFAQALAKTFDGHHPCDLCKHITKARDTEKKQDKQVVSGKTDLFCTTARSVSLPLFVSFEYPELMTASIHGAEQPPSPPRLLEI